MSGKASAAQVGALLMGLRLKGETVEELTGFVEVLRENVTRVRCGSPELIDTCGTGGDGMRTFNVSTTAAFVASGAGLKVAKHGNRAMSSQCGSADVLEALGVTVALSAEEAARLIDEIGIAFLFVQAFHPAAKYVSPVRREIGFRTFFNLVGPLTNPAFARRQVIGVPRPELTDQVGRICLNLGMDHVWVVHGYPGMDEVSTLGTTQVCEVRGGTLRTFVVDPADYGIPLATQESITGGGAELNAQKMLEVLRGTPGPTRDLVVLNAAAAMVVGGAAGDLKEGLHLAARSIDQGAALAKLQALRAAGAAK